MLSGYGTEIFYGALETLRLSLLSLVVAFLVGLLGATAKLSGNRLSFFLSTCYTTLIRGVPDLVLMLLTFYSIQIALNVVTDRVGATQVDISPFWAGSATIGLVYGAYFVETFRGAYLSISRGQIEAAMAYGMTYWTAFKRIIFPQLMLHALPGISNNWQVIVKATALVSIIGLSDLVKAAQNAGRSTFNSFFFMLVAACVYLVLAAISTVALDRLERHYSRHARGISR
ncbi:ABC transporter permease subunit [Paraburkholderia sp. BL10I2N1]|uniref:ABC transporter permease n=1 Tax=Paraburkholderia sp. BL10I2N1 TaxID=1938796 RepID=UPI00105EFF74|nr:ABC transporter permease subunit [Paraburkholderia sp. BL10I2N1]TDN63099.1 amino acid ABC transporter membrane protein 1 (PAAT family) [Paraburkholderia sp. BL10I2N1]